MTWKTLFLTGRFVAGGVAVMSVLLLGGCGQKPSAMDWRAHSYIHDDCKLMDLETYGALNLVWQPGKGDLDDLNRRYQAARSLCLAGSVTADPLAAMVAFNAIQEQLGVAGGDLDPKCLDLAMRLRISVVRDLEGLVNVAEHYSKGALLYAEGVNLCTPGWPGANPLLGWHTLHEARRAYGHK